MTRDISMPDLSCGIGEEDVTRTPMHASTDEEHSHNNSIHHSDEDELNEEALGNSGDHRNEAQANWSMANEHHPQIYRTTTWVSDTPNQVSGYLATHRYNAFN